MKVDLNFRLAGASTREMTLVNVSRIPVGNANSIALQRSMRSQTVQRGENQFQ